MSRLTNVFIFVLVSLFIWSCSVSSVKVEKVNNNFVKDTLVVKTSYLDKAYSLKKDFTSKFFNNQVPNSTKIDSIKVDTLRKCIEINFNKDLSYIAFREGNVGDFYKSVKNYLGNDFNNYDIKIKTMGITIEELIPNFYRKDCKIDSNRIRDFNFKRTTPIIENISKPYKITKGLYNKNISLWHSHGWYYNSDLERWEWQRPRLFQTVEDLIPLQFVIPYIAPMLENAGANVFIPRERDFNETEIIIDNDTKEDIKNGLYLESKKNDWKVFTKPGFAKGNPPYEENFNPFLSGTAKYSLSSRDGESKIKWVIKVPESGEYCLYLSYVADENNATDVVYKIKHSGNISEFKVNQTIGGNTWLYVGKFLFNKDEENYVELSNKSQQVGKYITADAIRIGGGMGIVKRNGSTSGRPKFVEAAKYYLQYAGMPDTLIYNFNNNKNDYSDDYRSRNEYANYLIGAPFGPNKNRNIKGLGIPIDLTMAFHTDAGITKNDTTIGTLAIYSLKDINNNITFPDGKSRLACRDLSDIVQTSIVDDIRSNFDIAWNKRQLREAQYAEAQRPNVPALLLELLSHQNFLDMKYMLDPQFRFIVSRAIYKGMLKYLSYQNNCQYVVQPLPVKDFYTEFTEDNKVKLSWEMTIDKDEPTAIPTGYVVYIAEGDKSFDNGIYVKDNYFVFDKLKENKIYRFKITAVNEGGESFPSEILSVCKTKSNKTVLIVNAFDRVSAPQWVDGDNFSGFLSNLDFGVPDKYDLGFTGYQTDFNPNSPFVSNDEPGHGASNANYETKVIAGNTFNHPYIHGLAFAENGLSFVSSSKSAFEKGKLNLNSYKLIDIIAGEQKSTPYPKKHENDTKGVRFKLFTKEMQNRIKEYLLGNGNIFISGAYIATDVFRNEYADSNDAKFVKEYLKYNIASGYASKTGEVHSVDNLFLNSFKFNTELNNKIYAVEAPDAILPINGSKTILRFMDNEYSAAVAYKGNYGIVAFGFPFETILESQKRKEIIKNIIQFLNLSE